MLLSICPSQAENLLQGLEKEVRASIQKDYGNNEGATSLWNATMTEVPYSILYLFLII